MKVFFCTACEAGLLFGDRRCEHCGELAGSPQSFRAAPCTRLARIGAFFESQAGLSLTTLVVFLGLGIALVPVGWNYTRLQAQTPALQAQTAAPTSLPTGRAAADVRVATGDRSGPVEPAVPAEPCHPLQVFFAETAMVGEVAELLHQAGTSIAFGPDKNGAYELAVPEKAAPAVAELLGRAEDTVQGVFIQPRCGRS